MSDNKLLAESTIRRFMKLANVDTLSDNFIETLEERGPAMRDEKPAMRGEKPAMRGEKPAKAHDDDEKPAKHSMREDDENEGDGVEEEMEDEDMASEEGPDAGDEEMELDAELGADEPDMGAADMSLTEEEAQVLVDLGERLRAAMGGAGAEPEMDDMDDMDDMGDMDQEEEPAMGYDSEPMMEEERDEIVQEVLKRVTKRLLASKLSRK